MYNINIKVICIIKIHRSDFHTTEACSLAEICDEDDNKEPEVIIWKVIFSICL